MKEDISAYKSTVLKAILMGFGLLSLFASITSTYEYYLGRKAHQNTVPILIPMGFLILSLVLIKLVQCGYHYLVAWSLLGLLLLATLQVSATWGFDVYQAVAIYSLIIVVGGIIISPKATVALTLLIIMSLSLIYFLHSTQKIIVSREWISQASNLSDLIVLNCTYLIIALVSWFSGRGIQMSLDRAIISENKATLLAKRLKKQNDDLEILVAQKTKQLRDNQLKQMINMNNFAEFGKLAAGLLHDIKNPLTVISLNLDSLKQASDKLKDKGLDLGFLVEQSLLASKTAEEIIRNSQKQLAKEEKKVLFDMAKEIKNVILLLKYQINKEKVQIIFDNNSSATINGYPNKFSRIIANLISNSIDAFEKVANKDKRIILSIKKTKIEWRITIEDNALGIKDKDKHKIFQPLFSTKGKPEKSGVGLYVSKKMVEGYFNGNITFTSKYKAGSKFVVHIPINA